MASNGLVRGIKGLYTMVLRPRACRVQHYAFTTISLLSLCLQTVSSFNGSLPSAHVLVQGLALLRLKNNYNIYIVNKTALILFPSVRGCRFTEGSEAEVV